MDFKPIAPMLAFNGDLERDKDYVHEIKWDGYRTLAFMGSSFKLQSRGLFDVTKKYPEIASVYHQINLEIKKEIIIDGEIICINEKGLPDFSLLKARDEFKKPNPVIYVAFDILFCNGNYLFQVPFIERRGILDGLLGNLTGVPLMLSALYKSREELMKIVKDKGLEGIISKVKDSSYLPGKRSPLWIKYRNIKRQKFVVISLNFDRDILRSLELGVIYEGKIFSVGSAGAGLSGSLSKVILDRVKELKAKDIGEKLKRISYENGIKSKGSWNRGKSSKGTYTVKITPVLICDVEYLEVTRDKQLRHPVIKGISDSQDFSGVIVNTDFFIN